MRTPHQNTHDVRRAIMGEGEAVDDGPYVKWSRLSRRALPQVVVLLLQLFGLGPAAFVPQTTGRYANRSWVDRCFAS